MEFPDRPARPVTGFAVYERPTAKSKGKAKYQAALVAAARAVFPTLIPTSDIELEIYYVTSSPTEALDVDNVAKPTLDGLKGVVYADDRQVRAVRLVKVDKTQSHWVAGRIGPLQAIYRSQHPHAVWIWVYSPSESRKRGRSPTMPGWDKHIMLAPHFPSRRRVRTRRPPPR